MAIFTAPARHTGIWALDVTEVRGGSSIRGFQQFQHATSVVFDYTYRLWLKTVIRVSQVSADESLGSVIGGWGPAGATPRAQGGGGRCE